MLLGGGGQSWGCQLHRGLRMRKQCGVVGMLAMAGTVCGDRFPKSYYYPECLDLRYVPPPPGISFFFMPNRFSGFFFLNR